MISIKSACSHICGQHDLSHPKYSNSLPARGTKHWNPSPVYMSDYYVKQKTYFSTTSIQQLARRSSTPVAHPLFRAGLTFLTTATPACAGHAEHVVICRICLINRHLEVHAVPTARLGIGARCHVQDRVVSANEGVDCLVAHLSEIPGVVCLLLQRSGVEGAENWGEM